jgi:hypothetical protein
MCTHTRTETVSPIRTGTWVAFAHCDIPETHPQKELNQCLLDESRLREQSQAPSWFGVGDHIPWFASGDPVFTCHPCIIIISSLPIHAQVSQFSDMSYDQPSHYKGAEGFDPSVLFFSASPL